MDNFRTPKITIKHQNYKENINKVWEVARDLSKWVTFYSDTFTMCKWVKGNNTYEVGNECMIFWGIGININIKCLEICDEENYKKAEWLLEIPLIDNLTYHMTFYLFDNTIKNDTLILLGINFLDPNNVIFTEEAWEGYMVIVQNILDKMGNYLKSKADDSFQYESVIINTSRQNLWELVTNWVEFRKVAPEIGQEIKIEGDQKILKTKFQLVFHDKNITCDLSVIKCNHDNDSIEWSYGVECSKNSAQIPPQEIYFNIVNINDNSCYLLFKHIFKGKVKSNFLKSLSNEKQKILSNVQNHFKIIA
jgi:hypothetical protein